jgi:hypothetical protein
MLHALGLRGGRPSRARCNPVSAQRTVANLGHPARIAARSWAAYDLFGGPQRSPRTDKLIATSIQRADIWRFASPP